MKLLLIILLFQEKAIGVVQTKDTIDTYNNCRFLIKIRLQEKEIIQPIYMPCDWIKGDSMVFHGYYKFDSKPIK